MKFRTIELVLIPLLVLSMLLAPSAGLDLSGAIFKGEALPGQEIDHEITVSLGEGESAQNVTVEVFGFAMNENGSNIQLAPEDDNGIYSAREYLTVIPEVLQLQPGEPQKVQVKANIPEDVGSGGKYALITLTTTAPLNTSMNNVKLLTAIQVPVLLMISGTDIVKNGEISDLTASKSGESVMVNLRFKNTGNYHYKPIAKSVLKTRDGEILAEASQQSSSAILPTGTWFFSVPIVPESELTHGTYTIETNVTDEDGTILNSEEIGFNI